MPIEWDLNKRVVIRNIGECATKNEIKILFERYGKINKLWVARNPPGLAFLEYEKRQEAEKAARQLDGKRCCGCYIKVDLSKNCPLPTEKRHHSRRTHELNQSSRHEECEASTSNRRSHSRNNDHKEAAPTRRRYALRRNKEQTHLEETLCLRNRSRNADRQRLDCSICLDNLLNRKPTMTVCRHIFCSSCIRRAVQLKGKCPICQADAVEKELQTVYLNP